MARSLAIISGIAILGASLGLAIYLALSFVGVVFNVIAGGG